MCSVFKPHAILESVCTNLCICRYEHVSGSELRRRYPQFEVDDEYEAVIDFKGGMVDAAQANAVHVALARQRGATVVDKCKVCWYCLLCCRHCSCVGCLHTCTTSVYQLIYISSGL